jgi:hypothetical protein
LGNWLFKLNNNSSVNRWFVHVIIVKSVEQVQ